MSSDSTSTSLSWSPSIPCVSVSSSDILTLESKFRFALPSALKELFLQHSGQQVQPSVFYAQNVTNGKWIKEAMGPLYPACAIEKEENAAEEDEDDEDGSASYNSYNVTVVNEMFNGDLLDEDDGDEEDSNGSVPFFVFSESLNSGHLLAIDTRSNAIMMLDVTHRKGPWIVAENIDDFLKRLSEGNPRTDDVEDADDPNEDDDMADMDGDDDEDDDGDAYCCDGCMDEFKSGDSRWNCNECKNYDLCNDCKKKFDQRKNGSSKKKKSTDDDQHPIEHTFTLIQGDQEQKE